MLNSKTSRDSNFNTTWAINDYGPKWGFRKLPSVGSTVVSPDRVNPVRARRMGGTVDGLNRHQDFPQATASLPTKGRDPAPPQHIPALVLPTRPHRGPSLKIRWAGVGRPFRGGRNSSGSRLRLDPRMVRWDVLFFDCGTFVAFYFPANLPRLGITLGRTKWKRFARETSRQKTVMLPLLHSNCTKTACFGM